MMRLSNRLWKTPLFALALSASAFGQREVWRSSVDPGGISRVESVDDLDGDLYPELILSYPTAMGLGPRIVLRSGRTGAHTATRVVAVPSINSWWPLVAGGSDCNGDGRGDLLVSWLSAPSGSFQARVLELLSWNGSWTTIWERRFVGEPDAPYIASNELFRCGDLDGDGVEDFVATGLVTGSWQALILSGRTGQTIRTIWGHSWGIRLHDLDGDFVPDLHLFPEIYSGATGQRLSTPSGRSGSIREIGRIGIADLVQVSDSPLSILRRLRAIGGSEVWSIAPQAPVVRFISSRPDTIGDIDFDGMEDVLQIGEDSSQQRWMQVFSGSNGSLIRSDPVPTISVPTVLPQVPGHVCWLERNELVMKSFLPEDAAVPLRVRPDAVDWRQASILEVEGLLPPGTTIQVDGAPLAAQVTPTATTIRGTLAPSTSPGLSSVRASSPGGGSFLATGPLPRIPALATAIGGGATAGGFLQVQLWAQPNRGAMLWLSTGYSAAPIAVPPIAFHALTDPLVLIPIYFGATDATGRLRLRVPFSADPYLASAPMVMQAMVLQAFPFDGSFTNAVQVSIAP